ncbi:MAG: DMT family transporter [Bacteroidetes bacterium]|nr:DMT family transporter [Bacteroidota bacterium]
MLRRYRYALALLFAVAVWGANVPILKIALREVPTSVANAFRFSLSAVTLGVLGWTEMRRLGRPFLQPWREHKAWLIALGVLAYVLYQEAFILGITRTSSLSVGLINATSPLWTALLAHATNTQRMRRAGWVGLLVSFSGALVVVVGGRMGHGEDTLTGNLIVLFGSVMWSAFTVLSRRLTGKVPAATVTFYEILVALPVLYLLAVPDLAGFHVAAVSGATWAALVFSGVLSVGLTLVIWNLGVEHLGPTATGAYSNLIPLATAVAAYVLLGDLVSPVQLVGGALILGGLVGMRRGLAR